MSGIRCVSAVVSTLGEGPVWSVEDGALYWIDVPAQAVYRWTADTDRTDTWAVPGVIGSLALSAAGGLIVSLRQGLHRLDLEQGTTTFLLDPEADRPGNRFNDATVDALGRFWVGSMRLDEQGNDGGLYLVRADGTWEQKLAGIGLSNGIGFSPDRTVMYHTDSLRRTISAFDFDLAAATMTNRRDFAIDTDCFPDGLTVDAEGYVWSAKWAGWRIVRYAPDGRIDRVVDLPVQCPTSVAFGGPDLDQLYITSGRKGLSERSLQAGPLAGRLLVLDSPGVTGRPEPRTAL
jgi:sugar lactone lactonase YvrE